MNATTFRRGDKVRCTIFPHLGTMTVLSHEGSMVTVYERCADWFHPTKLVKVSK